MTVADPVGLADPGFADPVRDSQATFRAVLDAMARPGTIHTVTAPQAPPPGLDRATAAVLLTLVDGDSPLYLDPAAAPHRDWLAFHCGANVVPAPQSSFALTLGPLTLEAFNPGSDEAPEDGATVIIQIPSLETGPRYLLSGPGLPRPTPLTATGLPPSFPEAWAANHARFPRGLDLILCAGNHLTALPRTVSVEAA